jgi:hypothetical protein
MAHVSISLLLQCSYLCGLLVKEGISMAFKVAKDSAYLLCRSASVRFIVRRFFEVRIFFFLKLRKGQFSSLNGKLHPTQLWTAAALAAALHCCC